MNPRQHELLTEIIERYTDTAQPVSSLQIANAGSFDVSPATIRNDMAALEAEGYIAQPHTSSGRIPTEKGYRYFIQHSLQQRELASRQRKALEEVGRTRAEYRNALKELAKAMAALSSNASFVSVAPHEAYVTGLGNLLSQPEFIEHDLARELAVSVDRFDELVDALLPRTNEQLSIFVGSENPLNQHCSAMFIQYQTRDGRGVIGLLGPLRMDYQHNAAILRHAGQLISELID